MVRPAWIALLLAVFLAAPASAQAVRPADFGDCSPAAAEAVFRASAFPAIIDRELRRTLADLKSPLDAFCADLDADGLDELVVSLAGPTGGVPIPWGVYTQKPGGPVVLAFHARGEQFSRLRLRRAGAIPYIEDSRPTRRPDEANCCPTGPTRRRYLWSEGGSWRLRRDPPRARTTYTGRVTCGGRPLRGALVQLRPDGDLVDGRPIAEDRTDAAGSYSFVVRATGDAHTAVVALRDPGRVRVTLTALPPPVTWTAGTPPVAANRPAVDLQPLGLPVPQTPCDVFTAMRAARRDWDDTVGGAPPGGETLVQWGALGLGVPYAAYTIIEWPTDVDRTDLTRKALHEFAHTVRHKYDGNLAHFAEDVFNHGYARQHQLCLATNEGFAFNEGWAEYWSRETAGCHTPRNPVVEGDVAASLRELARACGATRARMVGVLRRHPRRIHSFREFRSRLLCRGRQP